VEDPALKRVLWRCRRGTRELDIILSSFATARYAVLSEYHRARFESLLGVQDPVLTDWLCHDAVPDQEFVDIVALVVSFKSADPETGSA